ncbi:hypothetical protein BB561_005714 [Smittium simulii]|uniref:SET domain-containing protein n=1 Tax=Smittium simulii TaxID=133385 RepID=A0A2T9Y8V2_9FUNG|nr:hypothetical protein BB561_005714 [Smittium simulii]
MNTRQNLQNPKNWPQNVEYVRDLQFLNSKITENLSLNSQKLQYPQADMATMERLSSSTFYATGGSSASGAGKNLQKLSSRSNPLVTIKIESLEKYPSHPAYPYSGLFATKDLKPGQLITPYYGRATSAEDTDPKSDYCLRLGELTVDANIIGNEGRFVNDYRGIMQKPNAEFREFINIDHNRVEMGIFVIKAKDMPRGIRKKTEITVSYGKAFWKSRNLLRETSS